MTYALALLVVLIGGAAAVLVIRLALAGTRAEVARQSPEQQRRGRVAGAAVLVLILLGTAALIAFGPKG